jgi:Zn-finger nucleic acid-binding protein
MNCPVCKDVGLQPRDLGERLPGHGCGRCGGTFIRSTDYQEWLRRHGANLPERPPTASLPVPADTHQVKVCPACGHLMGRHHVGHEISFAIDHCDACQGIWLDRSEWEILVARGLHDDLHLMFSQAWQRAVRDLERRHHAEAGLRKRFGQDLAELERIRRWIEAHPQRSAILAFLNDRDPYR